MNKDKVINDLLSRIATLEYEVERLEQENDLDCNLNKSLLKDIDKAGKEIERLNNIIKELDNLISVKIIRVANEEDYQIDINDIVEIKTKLLELKGSDK